MEFTWQVLRNLSAPQRQSHPLLYSADSSPKSRIHLCEIFYYSRHDSWSYVASSWVVVDGSHTPRHSLVQNSIHPRSAEATI